MSEIVLRPSGGNNDDEPVHLGEVSREAFDAALEKLYKRGSLRIEKISDNEYVYHKNDELSWEYVEKQFSNIVSKLGRWQ